MAALVFTWLALSSTVLAQDECENGVAPVYIDFHDRHVNNSIEQIQYGLFVGVGTPSQNQSLWPSLMHNETTFSSPGLCDNSSNPTCLEQTHGVYRPEDSDSFREIDNYSPRDSSGTPPASVNLTGNDTLNIFTHYFDPSPPNVTHIDDFPLSQLTDFDSDGSPWFGPSGHLGLGTDSPVLQKLVDQGEITSRSFGLYVGTAYPRAGGAINGSLTLGGYDSGRLEGDAHNFTLATDYDVGRNETPYRVTIDSLTLLETNNNNNSISLSDSPFDAYLTTDQFSMTFPTSATDAFVSETSAETRHNDFSEPTFYLPSSANYTLVITLSTGLQVQIPSTELRNASDASPVSAPPETSSPALLGTAFLSHLYLTANHDATPDPLFFLNTALPHGPYVMTRPLCATSVPIMAEHTSISGFRANGLIGAVLGGVIGGIGLSFAAWWCFARIRRRKEENLNRNFGDAEDEEMKGAVSIKNGVLSALGSPRSLGGGGSPKGDGRGATGGAVSTRVKLKGILRGSRGRRRDQKGKSRDVRYGGLDDAANGGGKRSWSGSGSSDGDEQARGYDMQQFSPVAVPAAYYGADADSASSARNNDPVQQQQQQEGADSPFMIGQALSSPSDEHDRDRSRDPRRNSDGATLRSISPVSPMSDMFATEPADYPLPRSSHSQSHSKSHSQASNSSLPSSSPPQRKPVPGAALDRNGYGYGYADVPLQDHSDGDEGSGADASANTSFLGLGSSSVGSSRPDLWLQTSRDGVAFSGTARTAKKLKVVSVNNHALGQGGGGGSVKVVEGRR